MTVPARTPRDVSVMDRQSLRGLLVAELARILSVATEQIDSAKAFDEYGLDSIDAVLAAGTLSEMLGKDLPPEFLLQHRTLDEVVSALAKDELSFDEDRPSSGLLEDQPIFVFTGGGPDPRILWVTDRCPSGLSFERASIGNWRDWIDGQSKLDDLVARVCGQIEARCPRGPLRLAGYSQGGQLAFATAVGLSLRGRIVQSVTLLDSSAEKAVSIARGRAAGLLSLAKVGVRAARTIARRLGLTSGSARVRPGFVRTRMTMRLYRLCSHTQLGKAFFRRFARLSGPLFSGRGGIRLNSTLQMHVFFDMWQRWLAERRGAVRLNARVILFRSAGPGRPDRGWGQFCSSLDVISVEGDHLTMFDAHRLDALVEGFVKVHARPASGAVRTSSAA